MSFKLDFTGVGAPKCATTWIADCLREHPQICFPKGIKEVHFFNQKHIFHGDKLRSEKFEQLGIKGYENCFKDCKAGQKRGEFSTGYLSDPVACKRLKKYFPETKIIISVRDPVDRAYSEYFFDVRFGNYKGSFEEAIKQNPYIIEKGMYAKNIKLYKKNFKDIKIIFYEDIKNKPREVLKDLFKFLEVDENFIPASLNLKSNAASSAKFQWINRSIRKISDFLQRRKLNKILKIMYALKIDVLMDRIREINIKDLEREIMKPTIRKRLNKIYEDDVRELEKITGRNLSSWLS